MERGYKKKESTRQEFTGRPTFRVTSSRLFSSSSCSHLTNPFASESCRQDTQDNKRRGRVAKIDQLAEEQPYDKQAPSRKSHARRTRPERVGAQKSSLEMEGKKDRRTSRHASSHEGETKTASAKQKRDFDSGLEKHTTYGDLTRKKTRVTLAWSFLLSSHVPPPSILRTHSSADMTIFFLAASFAFLSSTLIGPA